MSMQQDFKEAVREIEYNGFLECLEMTQSYELNYYEYLLSNNTITQFQYDEMKDNIIHKNIEILHDYHCINY
jgi:hypothetical protein